MTKQEKALQKLGLSAEEIADVIKADKAIDNGAKLFELSEQKKKDFTKIVRGQRKKETKPRNRKPKPNRRKLLALLAEAVEQAGAKAEIINPETEINLTYEGEFYKIKLSCPYKKSS